MGRHEAVEPETVWELTASGLPYQEWQTYVVSREALAEDRAWWEVVREIARGHGLWAGVDPSRPPASSRRGSAAPCAERPSW